MRSKLRPRPRWRVSWLKLAAVGSVLLALGVAWWLYAPSEVSIGEAIPSVQPNPAVASSIAATFGPVAPPKAATKAVASAPANQRLVIDRIGVDVVISGGDPARALKRGAYHHAGTANPGQAGNVVLAGHRNRRAFTSLHLLRSGDTIAVYWMGKRYDYRVSKLFTVGHADTWILGQTGAQRLTLYTCLPRSLGNKRTVVIALPIQ